MEPQNHANGWQIRCTRCDFTEPWDKPAPKTKSGERKFIFGRCPHCKRIRFRAIERVPNPKAPHD